MTSTQCIDGISHCVIFGKTEHMSLFSYNHRPAFEYLVISAFFLHYQNIVISLHCLRPEFRPFVHYENCMRWRSEGMNQLYVPFVILQFCTSFSQEANDAFSTSVNFLFVPGVNGGIWVGISASTKKRNVLGLVQWLFGVAKNQWFQQYCAIC